MALSDHLHTKDWTFKATSHLAQRRSQLALNLLIASLGMFFSAALLGYLLIRLRSDDPPPLHLPQVLWLSTGFAIAGGMFLWRSLRAIRRERQPAFRRNLLAAFVCGLGFCLSQSIGLSSLLQEHLENLRSHPPVAATPEAADPPAPTIVIPQLGPNPSIDVSPLAEPPPFGTQPQMIGAQPQVQPFNRLEGLLFILVLLHILHFVAGMIGLSIVTYRGLKGRYDHEYHHGVRLCAFYWRFLDVVWVILFGAFLLTA